MCDFPETLAKTALTLALSPRRGNQNCPKALLLGEKGCEGFAPLREEGELVAHRVYLELLESQRLFTLLLIPYPFFYV